MRKKKIQSSFGHQCQTKKEEEGSVTKNDSEKVDQYVTLQHKKSEKLNREKSCDSEKNEHCNAAVKSDVLATTTTTTQAVRSDVFTTTTTTTTPCLQNVSKVEPINVLKGSGE